MSEPSTPDDQSTPPHVEPPRFLARTGRHGNYKLVDGRWTYTEPADDKADDLGYTGTPFRALDREPECVGPAILESYAQINARIYTQQHALEVAAAQQRRPELTPQNRHDDLHRRAKHAHVDLSHELHLVQRAIDKARMRDQPVSPAVLDRLERLEALMDGVSVLRMAA